jgi:hypothetical protein
MSDYILDTPSVARSYCPGCEPEVDPIGEIVDVRWCGSHAPQSTGFDDDVVSASDHFVGAAETGGEDNRRWCELLHRRS